MRAIYNRMVVDVIKEEDGEKMAGKIILPHKQNPYVKGKVVSIGQGIYQNGQRIPMDIKEGDIVIYTKGAGLPIEFGSDDNPTKVILSDVEVHAIDD